MNIGRLLFNRLRENGVDQTNDRRIVFCVSKISQIRNLVDEFCQINIGGQVLSHLCSLILIALIGPTQAQLKRRLVDFLKPKARTRRSSHFEQSIGLHFTDVTQNQTTVTPL